MGDLIQVLAIAALVVAVGAALYVRWLLWRLDRDAASLRRQAAKLRRALHREDSPRLRDLLRAAEASCTAAAERSEEAARDLREQLRWGRA